jgi:hypothetical protein
MIRRVFLLALVWVLLGFDEAACAEEKTPTVEGILYDREDPQNSVAVVNGVFLKKGDLYGDYEIREVEPNAVRVIDRRDGQETEFHITGGERALREISAKKLLADEPTKEKREEASPAAPASPPAAESSGSPDLAGEIMKLAGADAGGTGVDKGMLAQFASLFWEMLGMLDTRNVYLACQIYYLNEGGHAASPAELAAKKLVSGDLADGERGKYRFRIEGKGDDIRVYADPTDSSSGLRHFCMDGGGTLRIEKGRSADSESPAVSPESVLGWSI